MPDYKPGDMVRYRNIPDKGVLYADSDIYEQHDGQPAVILGCYTNQGYRVLFVDGWAGIAYHREIKPLDIPLPEQE